MTPTIAMCHWCDHDHAVTAEGYFLRHRVSRRGNPCKGSGRHKDTRPRPKKEKTP
jgi:hypothetical protein